MAMKLSPGKWHRLCSLSDAEGRLKMMAIDQRGSLEKVIAKVVGKEPAQVTGEDLAAAKESVTKILAPYATAVLTDPIYGYPRSVQHLPPGVALLLAHEESGYEGAGVQGKERKTRLIEGWSVDKAQHAGADAIKLPIYCRHDGSDDVRRHQQELMQCLGQDTAFSPQTSNPKLSASGVRR